MYRSFYFQVVTLEVRLSCTEPAYRVLETAQCWKKQSGSLFHDILQAGTLTQKLCNLEASISRQVQAAVASITTADRQLSDLQQSNTGTLRTQELQQQIAGVQTQLPEPVERAISGVRS